MNTRSAMQKFYRPFILQGENAMKPSKTALRELSAKYRAVLIKCALMNSGRADAVCGESLYNNCR